MFLLYKRKCIGILFMLFTEMLKTLDFMRFSGINNNINKLFTLTLSGRFGAKIKIFLRNLRKGVDK